MIKQPVSVAAIQFEPTQFRKEENILQLLALTEEAAAQGARLIVMPEWRYFAEQTRKAEALVRLGAAVQAPIWPGDLQGWRDLLARARTLDGTALRALYAPDAAARAAGWLEGLTDALWDLAPAGAEPAPHPAFGPLQGVAAE